MSEIPVKKIPLKESCPKCGNKTLTLTRSIIDSPWSGLVKCEEDSCPFSTTWLRFNITKD